MTDTPTAISAVYCNTKRVASRKAYQLVFEVPEENQALVHQVLGYPNSSESIWVAIARLNVNPEPEVIPEAVSNE
jgi:hypothetical protein